MLRAVPGEADGSLVSLASDCLEIGALFGGLAALTEYEHEVEEEYERKPRRRWSHSPNDHGKADMSADSGTGGGHSPVGPPLRTPIAEDGHTDGGLATPFHSPQASPVRKLRNEPQRAARERWASRRTFFAGAVGGTTGRMLCLGLRVTSSVTELGFLASMALTHTMCWCLRRLMQGLAKGARLCGADVASRFATFVMLFGLCVTFGALVTPLWGLAALQWGVAAGGALALTGVVALPFVACPKKITARVLGLLLFADEALWFIDKFTLLTLRGSYVVTHGVLRWLREALLLGRHLTLSAALASVGAAAIRETLSPDTRQALRESFTSGLPILDGIARPLRLRELWEAWLTVAALQRVAGIAPAGKPPSTGEMRPASEWAELLGEDHPRAFRFALATYGHMGLKFLGVLPYGDRASNNARAAKLCSGLPTRSVVVSDQRARLYQPAYVVWRDDTHDEKAVIVGLRGSVRLEDWLTDFVSFPEPCPLMGCPDGHAHAGMLRAARVIAERITPVVAELLRRYPRYKLLITGHSLGAGTACLLCALWLTEDGEYSLPEECRARERTRCVCYGVPPTVTPCISEALKPWVVSMAMGADLVPRLSQKAVYRIRDQVIALWRDQSALTEVSRRAAEAMAAEDYGGAEQRLWAQQELDRLAEHAEDHLQTTTPGIMLWWQDAQDKELASELLLGRVEDLNDFNTLVCTRYSLSAHMPQNYAAPLGALPEL